MKKFIIGCKCFVLNLLSHDVFTRSAALAYYFVFAIFPAILFLYSMLGFFSIDWSTILESIKSFLPSDAYEIIFNYIEYLTPRQSLVFLLTGLTSSVYSSYRAVKCIRVGLNLAFNSKGKRSVIQEAIRSLLFTLSLYICILLSFLALPIVSSVLDLVSSYRNFPRFMVSILELIRNLLSTVPFLACMTALYYLSPCKHIPLFFVMIGSSFSTIGIIVSSSILNIFTVNVFKYSRTYGSLATLVIFILWLYFIAFIILVGGEISSFIWFSFKERRKNFDTTE